MTYQQFLTEIQLQIHSLFDTDVTIQLHKIQKNNGVTLDGLTILPAELPTGLHNSLQKK